MFYVADLSYGSNNSRTVAEMQEANAYVILVAKPRMQSGDQEIDGRIMLSLIVRK